MKSAVYLRIEEQRDLLSVFTLFSLTLRLISKFRNAVRPSFSPILSHSCFSRRKNADLYLEASLSPSLSLLSQSFRNVEEYFSRLLFALFPTFISLYRIICFTNAHFQRSPSRPSASPTTRIPLYLHSRDILALTSFTNPCHSIIRKALSMFSPAVADVNPIEGTTRATASSSLNRSKAAAADATCKLDTSTTLAHRQPARI